MDLKEEYCQDLTKLTELSAGQSLTSLVFGVQMLSKYVARLNDGNAGAVPAPKPDKPAVAAVAAPQSTAQAAPTTTTEPAAPEADAAAPAPAKPRAEIKPNVSLRTVHHPLPTVKVGAAAARATGGATEDSAPIVVERRLSGAKAGAYFLKEHLVRTMGLQNGNKVIIPDGRFADMRIFDRTAEPDGIARINNVLLEEEEDLSYPYVAYADRSYIGNPLEYEGEPIRFEFTQSDLDYVKTQLGDVVDLAWYISRGPKSARISWVHYELKPLVLKKPAAPTPTPAKEKKVAEEDKPKHPTNIEFDLDGKRVLIIGFEDSLNGLRGIIEAHNGKYQCSEALQSNKLRTRVQGADLVIPVISQAHHINTNTALGLAKLQGKPYAFADGSSPLSLERAIYRALHHLPAYESRGADIEYPLTEDVEISITEE